ncbi:MAG: hypothetical protein AAFR59_03230, partial [Bacteroidota bacterium]
QGSYFQLEISGNFRSVYPALSEEIARMKGGRYIVKVQDYQGNWRIFGEKTAPMLVSSAEQLPTGSIPEVSLQLKGKSLYPPIYLEMMDTCQLIRQLGAANFVQPAIVPQSLNNTLYIELIRVQITADSRIASVIEHRPGKLYLDGAFVADISHDGLIYRADAPIQMQLGTYTFEASLTVIAQDGSICSITFQTTYISNQQLGGFPYVFPATIP